MRRAKERVLRALALGAGRTVAAIATDSDERAQVGWLSDVFWLGIARELEERGVSKRVAADMLGVSRRTYLRQQETARQQLSHPGLSTWVSVRDRLRQRPLSRKDLEGRYPSLHPRVIGALVHDMLQSGWLREDDGLLYPRDEDLELSDGGLDTLVAYEAIVDPYASAKEVATELGVDLDRVDRSMARLERGDAEIQFEAHDSGRWDLLHMLIVHSLDVARRIASGEPPGDTRAHVFFYQGDRIDELRERLESLRRHSREIMEEFLDSPLTSEHRGGKLYGWSVLQSIGPFHALFDNANTEG